MNYLLSFITGILIYLVYKRIKSPHKKQLKSYQEELVEILTKEEFKVKGKYEN